MGGADQLAPREGRTVNSPAGREVQPMERAAHPFRKTTLKRSTKDDTLDG